jgi:uncharacterized protein YceH (UPF0502 family)/predicted DNA-binding protein with PD1-like motif
MLPQLSPLEARVLGVLVEKQRTVPDAYPLSLNALTLGCNQKNNRDPVMQATERDVQAAIDALRPLSLVIESSGSRVMRYSHNVERVLHVDDASVAILAALMLRGPQTPGELRIATERLHRFADIPALEAALQRLDSRPDAEGGPLVVQLARTPGSREQRWAHLLCGPVEVAAARANASMPAGRGGQSLPGGRAADLHVLRLTAGDDLREALGRAPEELDFDAGYVVAAVGSLQPVVIRLAGRDESTKLDGPHEIVLLSGTLSRDGPHLHLAVADAEGRVVAGHLMRGSLVRTTVELLLGVAAGWQFAREFDAETGHMELRATRKQG